MVRNNGRGPGVEIKSILANQDFQKRQNSCITYLLFVTWFSKLDCEGGVFKYLYYTNNFLHMIEKEVRKEEHDISSTQMDGEE